MSFPSDQIAELRTLAPGASVCQEGAVSYFLLPGLRMPPGCSPESVDALLCPTPRDGYESRLFFSQLVTSTSARNWHVTNTRIVDRPWSAFSWKTNKTGLRLAQMVVEHLCALK
jgi:hypothetical protein